MIFIVIAYVLLVYMCEIPIWLELLIGIVVLIAAVFSIYKGLLGIIDRKNPIIKKILEESIEPIIGELDYYSGRDWGFNFPESLNDLFIISVNNDMFKELYKRRICTGCELKRFDKFCKKINKKNDGLINKATNQNVNVIHKEKGYHVLTEKGNKELKQQGLDKLLQEYNLDDDKKEIEKLRKKVPIKSKKLSEKLRKIKNKWG